MDRASPQEVYDAGVASAPCDEAERARLRAIGEAFDWIEGLRASQAYSTEGSNSISASSSRPTQMVPHTWPSLALTGETQHRNACPSR